MRGKSVPAGGTKYGTARGRVFQSRFGPMGICTPKVAKCRVSETGVLVCERIDTGSANDYRLPMRTPDSRFANLPGFPWSPRYWEWKGLRGHCLDEGAGEAFA